MATAKRVPREHRIPKRFCAPPPESVLPSTLLLQGLGDLVNRIEARKDSRSKAAARRQEKKRSIRVRARRGLEFGVVPGQPRYSETLTRHPNPVFRKPLNGSSKLRPRNSDAIVLLQ
jgi:hypothetical protein